MSFVPEGSLYRIHMIKSNDSVKGIPARRVFAPDQKHNQPGTKFDLSLHDTRMKSCTRTTVSLGLNSGMTCMENEMSFRVSYKHKQRNVWRWNELVPDCMSFWYVNNPPERAAEQRNESFGILSYVKKAVKLQSPMNPFFVSSRNDTQEKAASVPLSKYWRKIDAIRWSINLPEVKQRRKPTMPSQIKSLRLLPWQRR